MTKGPLIGRGARADIFAWGEDRVLKLFWEGANPIGAEHEALLARLVHGAGLPVPAVSGVVTVESRPGIIYERVDGVSLADAVLAAPWRLAAASRRTAALHAEIHAVRVPGPPLQRERLRGRIKRAELLPEELRTAALGVLDSLPDGDRLCHGDFHPGNIIVPMHGGLERAVVIDWPDASAGNPVADVARTVLLMRMMHHHAPSRSLALGLRTLASLFLSTYLKHYARLRPLPRSELVAWLTPLAAARLVENIREEERFLLSFVRRELIR